MYTLTLKKGEEKRIMHHPWVFANEVSKIEGKDSQGSVAKVVSFDGRFFGYGFINHLSKIIVRIISRDETPIDEEFFFNRIKKANDFRVSLGLENSYRVVFSESDEMPGLIVDKYDDHLCVQLLTLGMDIRKDIIVKALIKIFNPACIYERSDVSIREKEGLSLTKGVLFGTLNPNLTIEENGVKMQIDLVNGQKTGYFLDQRTARYALRQYCNNKDVLDCFCNQGGFSLNASIGKAKSITAIDISTLALECVENNARINNFNNVVTVAGDVFEKLREYKREGKKFDVIILDPPAFTKTVDTVKGGYKGYLDINTLALKLLNEGGILLTCSCSQHMTIPLFTKMLQEASMHSNVKAKLLDIHIQSPDHASMITSEEALYLKTAILKKF